MKTLKDESPVAPRRTPPAAVAALFCMGVVVWLVVVMLCDPRNTWL